MTSSSKQGFTLLEVIATIVISTIALVALLPLLDTVFARSSAPRTSLTAAFDLHASMEQIVSTNTNTLEALRLNIGPENSFFNGQHLVVHNRYIEFIGQVEALNPANPRLLKVTLQNQLGERLTRLFTEF
ncbi:MAG TPA: type II secretion system protein [Kiritimatiellia bacterium]|nr:type II secretion system protein [Kiritimatiellia bacterium]